MEETREGSSKAEQLSFQTVDGGALPTLSLQIKNFRVFKCDFKDIRHVFEGFHYKGGHMGGGISFCLGVQDGMKVIGGAVMGKPRHEGKYPKTIDIRRLAYIDEAPKNSESWLLGHIVRHIRKNTDALHVLSYSDLTVGHAGTIYKAANFKKIGETSPSNHVFWEGRRYHPRSLSIDRPYSYRLREAVKDGTATIEKGEPKSIWIYEITR